MAREKVARFRDETYWARPVPGLVTLTRASCCSASHRRRTAATGPGAFTGDASVTSSLLRCMRSGSPTGRSAGVPTTA